VGPQQGKNLYNDVSLVEKFEITEAEYNKKQGNFATIEFHEIL
jgi:hypothetical protein